VRFGARSFSGVARRCENGRLIKNGSRARWNRAKTGNNWQEQGEKKPPDSLAVFREFRVLRALSPLSIRQRPEMPKEIKIKLGGHGGKKLLVRIG
jgi:hypothetical protein